MFSAAIAANLYRLALLYVVARLGCSAQRAVRFLLFVFELELAEVQGNLVERKHVGVARASCLVGRNQAFGESPLQVLLLLLARLAANQDRRLDVVAGGASHEQLWAGLVDFHDEMEVLHRYLAGSSASPESHGAGLRRAEGPGFQVDLVLVFVIRAFSLNAFDLQEIISYCHAACSPFSLRDFDNPKKLPRITSWPTEAIPPPAAGKRSAHRAGSVASETPRRDKRRACRAPH